MTIKFVQVKPHGNKKISCSLKCKTYRQNISAKKWKGAHFAVNIKTFAIQRQGHQHKGDDAVLSRNATTLQNSDPLS